MTNPNPNYKCPTCGFSLWNPIAELKVSALGLYDDSRFPGRCILVLHEHAEDLIEMSLDLARAFVSDTQIAARAIQKVAAAKRINYAILGNVESHIHFHLIPRLWPGDPIPEKSPWAHPLPKLQLPPNEVARLVTSIRSAVATELARDVSTYATDENQQPQKRWVERYLGIKIPKLAR